MKAYELKPQNHNVTCCIIQATNLFIIFNNSDFSSKEYDDSFFTQKLVSTIPKKGITEFFSSCWY